MLQMLSIHIDAHMESFTPCALFAPRLFVGIVTMISGYSNELIHLFISLSTLDSAFCECIWYKVRQCCSYDAEIVQAWNSQKLLHEVQNYIYT